MNLQKIKTHLFPKGFTLIELIVVITILAILGTIGFLSIWGYSSKARDSSRISDVANISKSLDVSIITVGFYPTPDNSFAVTYSWGTIWNQGVIGTTVLQSLRTSIAGGGLSKKPVDPLDNSEYEYSSLAYGKSYQIKAEYEGDLNQTAYHLGTTSSLASLLASSLIEEAEAAPGAPTIAYIKGNYGGLMARTVTGSYTYILALPSIITSTGSTSTPKIEITAANALSGTLLFNGKSLKNASTFNPNLTPVFSGSGKVLTTSAEITTLMTNLKNTYTNSGASDVLSNTNIANLITMNTGSLTILWSNLVKNDLGITDGSGGNGDTTVSGVCTSLPSNAVYFNTTTSYSVTSAVTLSAVTAGYSASPTTNTCQYKCSSGFTWNGSNCGETPLYTFTSHTFTNCGQVGGTGPSLANCRGSYGGGVAWAQDTTNNYLNMSTNGIQLWTVPSTGTYTIDTYGAQGGNSAGGGIGWLGSRMKGDFSLTKWQVLKILVGQVGAYGTYSCPGGGGGTYVTTNANSALVVSGGGGAAYSSNSGAGGYTTNPGNTNGGSGAASGAGLTGDGSGDSWVAATKSFINGGTTPNSAYGEAGGFGGGGNTHGNCGTSYAGGGGYSWGNSGGSNGGYSYNSGTNQANTAGANSGVGKVIITKQ